MHNIPTVIGYKLDKALQLIGEEQTLILETATPYEDKKKERQGNTPIVVRQKINNDVIELTISLFK